jgi:hypothetical protein
MILCDGAFIITSRTKLVGSVRLLPSDKVISKYGELRYRGIDINELVNGFVSEERLGFEEYYVTAPS